MGKIKEETTDQSRLVWDQLEEWIQAGFYDLRYLSDTLSTSCGLLFEGPNITYMGNCAAL